MLDIEVCKLSTALQFDELFLAIDETENRFINFTKANKKFSNVISKAF